MFDLTGKKAIVTGAYQGLGKAMARGLQRAGAEVVIIDFSDQTDRTVQEFGGAKARIHGVIGNLRDRNDSKRAFDEAVEILGGRLDILINNAGVLHSEPALQLELETWDRVLELNITSVFQLCKWSGEIMIRQGRGKIINVASIRSFVGSIQGAAYSVSKGGIAQLTKSLSNEWARGGIQVNSIAPGYMRTTLSSRIDEDFALKREIEARIPAGRWGTPEDLEGIAVFLSSDASNYITGTVIPCDGGYLAR